MKLCLFLVCVLFAGTRSQEFESYLNGTYRKVERRLKFAEKMYKEATRSKRLLFPSTFLELEYQQNNLYATTQVNQEDTYDFIIVGSGPAGSVIANRLSENPEWKILLLEVGEEASAITDIPVIAPLFQFTNYNWNYLMEKQENVCLGLVDQRMAWPRGRALGGTSIINYMIHVRGNRQDYNKWAKLGNPGWSYKDVFQYFIKSEDSNIERQDPQYHVAGGYLSVSDVPFRTESAHAFVKAAQEAGHQYVDYNGKRQLGVSYVQATEKNGRRCSAESSFLRPIRSRKNLTILTKARAVKILIDPMSRTATGVQYVKDKQYLVATATKEVISSAGAFNSPQLLMLSGIGPKDHLQELGIPVIQDLPVGRKLYDHITFLGLVFTLNSKIDNDQNMLYDPSKFLELIINGTGPLTGLGGVEALAYIKTNVSKDHGSYPDMELIFLGGGLQTDRGEFYRKTLRVTDEIYNAIWKPIEGVPAVQVLPMLVHPKSFGYLRLKSSNPYKWPKFYGNYFTDPGNEDIKTFIAAIREVQKIFRSPSLQRYGATQVRTPIPGCQQHTFDTDEYWECALRHITPTLHHQVATCKMGPANDPEAVVDNKLRVYGIKNLRVADTSIIPIPLSAHTNVPSFMVGEKAADLIKNEWNESIGTQIDIRRKKNTK